MGYLTSTNLFLGDLNPETTLINTTMPLSLHDCVTITDLGELLYAEAALYQYLPSASQKDVNFSAFHGDHYNLRR